jgi:hypothetical protein
MYYYVRRILLGEMMRSYYLNAWIYNVHALELNLIFLRCEVIGAEGNLLV